jgi:hypothetical protein
MTSDQSPAEDRAHDDGVVFPRDEAGRRSTTATATAVWAEAVREVDPDLAARISTTRDWRKGYVDRVVEVTAAATRSPDAAVTVARAGLRALGERMRFERAGGSMRLDEAARSPSSSSLGRHLARGEGERERELVVPFRGDRLRGDALRRQVDDWAARSVLEESAATSLRSLVDDPAPLDLRDRAFAVLGAGAELGPTAPLLAWGATVAAVDVRQPPVTRRLLELARSGAGTLELPVAGEGDAERAGGADLLRDVPEIAGWLLERDDERPLTVGSYAYADGARHVQVAAASDALVERLLAERPGTSYAELATPTDAYAVPADVVASSEQRWSGRGWRRAAQAPVRALTRGSLYAQGYAVRVRREDGEEVGIADVLVPQQGPNYTLAKRLQRWRAVAASADGVVVSANVAPATSTRSVTKNRLLAAAYAGARSFGVEVFDAATSRVLMAALLVVDLRRGHPPLQHPDDLLVDQAVHGGLWRVAYAPRSVLGIAAVRGLGSVVRS